jgi:hypothetical protein
MGRSHLRLLAAASVGAAVAFAPDTAFADETVAEPSAVRPGASTVVIVGCTTDPGSARASSALFGDLVLSHAIEPGYYRARVTVPSTATAGTYPITGTCGTTRSTGEIVVSTGGHGPTAGKGNGPTLIGVGLIAAGAALAVLATRFRSRARA